MIHTTAISLTYGQAVVHEVGQYQCLRTLKCNERQSLPVVTCWQDDLLMAIVANNSICKDCEHCSRVDVIHGCHKQQNKA